MTASHRAAATRSHNRTPLVVTALVLVVVALVATTVGVLGGSGLRPHDFASEAGAYIPESVGGLPARTGPMSGSLARSVAGEAGRGVETVEAVETSGWAGAVLPAMSLFSFAGTRNGMQVAETILRDAAGEQYLRRPPDGNLPLEAKMPVVVEETTVGDVAVTLVSARRQHKDIAQVTAVARPTPANTVAAVSHTGDRRAALDAVETMLKSGSRS